MSRYTKYRLQFDDEKDFNDYDLRILEEQEATASSFSNGFSSSTGWTLGANTTISGGLLTFNPSVSSTSTSTYSGININAADSFLRLRVFTTSGSMAVTVRLKDSLGNTLISFNEPTLATGTTYVSDLTFHEDVVNGSIEIESVGGGSVSYDSVSVRNWGEVSNLQGTGDPLILEYDGDDILSPLKPSSLEINFYQESDSDDYTELFIPTKQQFKVDLYKNDSIFWTGWLGDDLVTITDISAPIPIQLTAYDGLHLLKTTDYFDTPLDTFRDSSITTDNFDYSELYRIIGKALYGTGNADEIQMYARINSAFVSSSQFFEKAYMYHGSFIENGVSYTSYEVLYDVLEALKCICYQRDGYWCIVKPSDYTYSAGSVVSRKYSGASNSNTSFSTITGDTNKLSSTITFNNIDSAASLTFTPANKRIVVTHNTDYNFNPTRFAYDEVLDTAASGFGAWISGNDEASGNSECSEVVIIKSSTNDNVNQDNSANTPKCFMGVELVTNESSGYGNLYDTTPFITNDTDLTGETHKAILSDVGAISFGLTMSVSCRPESTGDLPSETNVTEDSLLFYGYIRKENTVSGGLKDDSYYLRCNGLWKELDGTGTYYIGERDDDVSYGVGLNTECNSFNKFHNIEYGDYGKTFSGATFIFSDTSNPDATESDRHISIYLCPIASQVFHFRYNTAFHSLIVSPLFGGFVKTSSSEYIITNASGDYTYEDATEVKIGSNVISDGAGFIFFKNFSNTQVPSYNDFSDDTYDDLPLQSFAGLAHMLLTHKPTRKLEGTHYGDYKFGDIISYDSGITNTTGKFYPVTASINFRRARVDFNGDELIDNSSLSSTNFTNEVRFIGSNDNSVKYSL